MQYNLEKARDGEQVREEAKNSKKWLENGVELLINFRIQIFVCSEYECGDLSLQ